MIITCFTLSMVVNTLVTGLIVFKILKVFLEVKRAPGLGPTGGTTLGPIIFIIIESGMALFAIQLVRLVYSCVQLEFPFYLTFSIITGINQMFNVIITFIHFNVFVLLITFTWLGHRANNNGWPTNTVFTTGLVASMAVNSLMTGMIVFRILKATGFKPTSSLNRGKSCEASQFSCV